MASSAERPMIPLPPAVVGEHRAPDGEFHALLGTTWVPVYQTVYIKVGPAP